MKYYKELLIALIVVINSLFLNSNVFAQGIGINATQTSPHNSALLDLDATDKGFLITRVDTANIVSPAFGLMTLAPIDSCLYIYSGVFWLGMGGGGSNCICNCNDSKEASFKCGEDYTDTRDNEVYGTLKIGDQCWMSKNLNYATSSDSWCYDNDNNNCITHGRLYNWTAAVQNSPGSSTNPSGVQGACPPGWHVPSDDEWKELEMTLGMSQAEADGTNFRGTTEGAALKAVSFGGNNSSGFGAVPGGNRATNGLFYGMGANGIWWSSTIGGTAAWRRMLMSNRNDIVRNGGNLVLGYSVRCVMD